MRRLLFVAVICVLICVCLAGCDFGNKPANTNEEKNNEVNNNEETVKVDETDPRIKMANVWMSLPENVNMFWRIDEKNTNNGSVTQEYKRGFNEMGGGESRENGNRPKNEADWLDNYYFYNEYQGDYKWSSYVHFYDKGWDEYYFNGNYPASPQTFAMGRQYIIADEYTDEHEKFNIEGVGEIDAVKGTIIDLNGKEYTVYYSKDLGFNVKVENSVQAWYLTRFDTNVTSEFPHPLPDKVAISAAAAEKAKQAEQEAENNEDDNYYFNENGEFVPYDE